MNPAMRSAADITTVCCYYWCDFSSYVLSSLLVWLCQHDAVTVLFLLSLLPVIPHFLFNALLLLLALLRYPHRSNSDMSILIPWTAFVKRFTMPPVIPPRLIFHPFFLEMNGGALWTTSETVATLQEHPCPCPSNLVVLVAKWSAIERSHPNILLLTCRHSKVSLCPHIRSCIALYTQAEKIWEKMPVWSKVLIVS